MSSELKSLQGWYNHFQQHSPTDVKSLCEKVGVVCEGKILSDNFSGYIERLSEFKYKIVYNLMHPDVRQRFTIAHELGHFYLHRDILGKGTGDTKAYRSDVPGHKNKNITNIHEREANSFAADLLMPRKNIIKLKAEGKTFEDIQAILDVSPQALEFRLRNLGIDLNN